MCFPSTLSFKGKYDDNFVPFTDIEIFTSSGNVLLRVRVNFLTKLFPVFPPYGKDICGQCTVVGSFTPTSDTSVVSVSLSVVNASNCLLT